MLGHLPQSRMHFSCLQFMGGLDASSPGFDNREENATARVCSQATTPWPTHCTLSPTVMFDPCPKDRSFQVVPRGVSQCPMFDNLMAERIWPRGGSCPIWMPKRSPWADEEDATDLEQAASENREEALAAGTEEEARSHPAVLAPSCSMTRHANARQ